jgi:hypothetical protein
MRKLIAVLAVAAGLMLGSVANAAQVDIFLTQTAPTDWTLSVNNNGSAGVGIINFIVEGLDTMALNLANAAIDPTGSLAVDPFGEGLGQNSVYIPNATAGSSIVPGNTLGSILATLSGPGPVLAYGPEAVPFEGTAVISNLGVPIQDYSITVVPTPTTPEPVTMILLGVGLAALGLVRRSA